MSVDNKLVSILEQYKCGPYFNFDEVRNFGNRAERLARMIGRKLDGDQESVALQSLPPDHIPEAEVCRWLAGKKLIKEMNLHQYTARKVAAESGLDFTAISMYLRMKRPFSCKMSSLQPLTRVLDLSCNNFLMGADSDIMLPFEESALVNRLIRLSETEKERLSEIAADRWKQYMWDHKSQTMNGLHRPINELLIDRLEILNKAKGRPLSIFFGTKNEDNPIFLRTIMKRCEEHTETEEFISMSTLIFLAFETGYPIDWFVCEEPLVGPEKAKVKYTDNNGVVQELKDYTIINLMNAYLALPAEERIDLFYEMCKSILNNTETDRAEEIENAKAMYRGGLAIDVIAKYTKLSPDLLRAVLTA
jgi:transcriptional regulator with XRE-family HTH domain